MQQRQIKFRFVEDAGTPNAKLFPMTEDGITACLAGNKDDQYGYTVDEYLRRFFFDPFPNVLLEQFTGLLDKNGKEIYEGDAFSCIYFRDGHADHWYYVMYDDVHGRFDLQRVGPPCPQRQVRQALVDVSRNGCIGNIHENPDLIESGATTQEK